MQLNIVINTSSFCVIVASGHGGILQSPIIYEYVDGIANSFKIEGFQEVY